MRCSTGAPWRCKTRNVYQVARSRSLTIIAELAAIAINSCICIRRPYKPTWHRIAFECHDGGSRSDVGIMTHASLAAPLRSGRNLQSYLLMQ